MARLRKRPRGDRPRSVSVPTLLQRLRPRYLAATGEDAARIAAYIADALDAGTITGAQCRAVWGGITASAWNAIEKRMKALRDALDLIDAARGE